MIVEMQHISKSFGSNLVLDQVDFSVQGGEIHALLGENGAGKSTLMNILGGVVPRDAGQVLIDGKPVVFSTPAESLHSGIAFIHQELNLVNDLAIFENMFIGREIKKRHHLLDTQEMIRQTQEVFDRMDLKLDPRMMVRDLDASYKQIVEICRAMIERASIIIMDEPTTSLTESEIQRVFALMLSLKEQGVGIVFISHKLKEVLDVCTRYSVLRDGVLVANGAVTKHLTTAELAYHMVGHKVRNTSLHLEDKREKVVLRLDGLSDGKYFRNITLEAHRGEILGVTGLLGDGRSELFQSVFGFGEPYEGQVTLLGNPIRCRTTWEAVEHGIAYVPRNRKENGIIKDLDILENESIVILKRLTRHGLIDEAAEKTIFATEVKDLSIKLGKYTDPITSLSGGNQQKIVLAKWLASDPSVLILDNPTQGVDVGAKEEIYDIILKLAGLGVAIIVLSSEAQEITRVCSRAMVMFHGEIMGEVAGDQMTEHTIMRLATGERQGAIS
ncbi:MAG: sugar ABC transporter ATP-binding protein [Sphaerochaetaceae bacterium]